MNFIQQIVGNSLLIGRIQMGILTEVPTISLYLMILGGVSLNQSETWLSQPIMANASEGALTNNGHNGSLSIKGALL